MKARSEVARDLRKALRLSPLAAGLRSLLHGRTAPLRAPRRAPARRMRFEPIEPRLLLDADPVLVTGAIDSPGESDTYSFTLDSDSRIAFDSLTNNPNITWTLKGPRGEEVGKRALAGAGGENTDAVLDLKAGQYTLTLDGTGDATGDYSFRLLTLSDSLSTTPGTPTSGELTVGSETDSYQFAATAGDGFYFEVTSLTGPTPNWRLLDPLGKSVFSEPMASAEDVKTVALTGLYTLLIEGQPQATESTEYTFNVQPVTDETAARALGPTVNGAIAHAGQRDTFTFTLTDARQVYFDSFTDDPDLTWSLTGPRGTVVPPRALASADSVDQGGAVLFDLAPGDYTLTLDGTLAATGAYSFRLLDLST
ncbi:MAG TPA: LEPR-XLL domain-containing protein, partial [Gammaproteobacteria bacterium]|nr:LEPR-XLL domain-containing protein [Gammaproteobacteria bacterium]